MPSQEEVKKYAKKHRISVEEAAKRIFGAISKIRRKDGSRKAEKVAEGISRSINKMSLGDQEYELIEETCGEYI